MRLFPKFVMEALTPLPPQISFEEDTDTPAWQTVNARQGTLFLRIISVIVDTAPCHTATVCAESPDRITQPWIPSCTPAQRTPKAAAGSPEGVACVELPATHAQGGTLRPKAAVEPSISAVFTKLQARCPPFCGSSVARYIQLFVYCDTRCRPSALAHVASREYDLSAPAASGSGPVCCTLLSDIAAPPVMQVPFPKTVQQDEPQNVLYSDNLYVLSPYHIGSQNIKVGLLLLPAAYTPGDVFTSPKPTAGDGVCDYALAPSTQLCLRMHISSELPHTVGLLHCRQRPVTNPKLPFRYAVRDI